MLNRRYLLAFIASIFPMSVVAAAPLNPDLLPKDAMWVVHFDYDAFSDSAIAEQIRSSRPQLVEEARKWFQENCGIDPRNDIESLTLFSSDYKKHSGAALFCGSFDEEKVKAHLQSKHDATSTEWEGHTFYTWTMPKGHGGFGPHAVSEHADSSQQSSTPDENQEKVTLHEASGEQGSSQTTVNDKDSDRKVTAVLIEGKKAVLAGSLDRAKEVVRLIKGEVPTLKADSKLLEDMEDGTIAYGAAIDLGEISAHERPFPILSQHERVQWSLGEEDDQMFETLVLVAERPKVAREMEKAIEGLIALGKVWAGDLEQVRELYEDTEISRDGATVEVEWEGDIDDVMAALDELRPRFQAWREYREKARR